MMNVHKKPEWDSGQPPTDEKVVVNRREWLRIMGFVGAGAIGATAVMRGLEARPSYADEVALTETPKSLRDLFPAKRNTSFKVKRALTRELDAISYNNFYEFDANSKTAPAKMVSDWSVRPWEIEISGLVKKPIKLDVDALQRKFTLEERVYRFRCVEAWAMTVPWIGFPMRRLIEWVEPLSSARFIRFVSFHDPENAPGQENRGYKWPYYEGLRMDEAMNDLAMFVTGMYGKPLPKQNGAPLRAIVPWKYGYKSPKSIVKIEFVADQPGTFWNDAVPNEYSFLSNVEPTKPHPRWSQASERILGEDRREETLPFNGYANQVAKLYT